MAGSNKKKCEREMMASSETDDDAAARWAVRLDAGTLGATDQAALDRWLAGNERRHGTLLRAEAALAYLDRGRAMSAAYVETRRERSPLIRASRILAGASALAAALILAIVILPVSETGQVEIATAVGEIRRVPLSDGSVASVNTNSDVEVQMKPDRRNIRLRSGEAWFQVAHDKMRPFVVEAGEVRIMAVGTAFSVRRRLGGADVLVTEGVVEAWSEARGTRIRIAAGNRGFVPERAGGSEVALAPGGLDRALAWRTGELALDGESLAYAAAELNRYNSRKIVIDDAALAREPLVGYFRVDQPEAFGRAVGSTIGARVRIEGRTIHLSR